MLNQIEKLVYLVKLGLGCEKHMLSTCDPTLRPY
jgi:hypothetical protein